MKYLVLTPKNRSAIQEKTGYPMGDLLTLIIKGRTLGGRYVVFYINDTWRHVFIHDSYSSSWFMSELFARLKL